MEPRIAQILVRGGVINRDQLKEALDIQEKNGTNLVHELVRLGYTNEDKLTSFLGQQFGIEMVDLESVEIQDPAFNLGNYSGRHHLDATNKMILYPLPHKSI